MKSILLLAYLIASVSAFQRAFPSSFTGRATTVCSREELTTELSCPPSRINSSGRSSMSMPLFLKKFGLRKPKKPIFGGEKEETTGVTAVLPVPANSTALKPSETPPEDKKEEETKSTALEISEILPEDKKEEEKLSGTQKTMQQVKDAGLAGVISYAIWETGFWIAAVPVCIFGYREVTGHWPDFQNQEDLAKLGAEAFAFVNFARFAVPLRIGLALSTTPWIQENIVDRFLKKDKEPNGESTSSE